MFNSKYVVLMASCVILAVSSASSAAVLYDNTSTTVDGADNATSTTYIASAFTTGSATSALTASLLLEQATTGIDTVSVYSSSTYTPDSLIGVLTASSTASATSVGLVTFSSTSLSLSANTTYWLVLSSTGSVAWSYSSDPTLTDAWAMSTNSGVVWSSTGDSYPYVFSVSDTVAAVPEPATLSLLGLSGVALLRRKRI
ncbi:MAG TPA: PEP-CTERM sorting domain-containing protein [Phycisphaerae bacterium]|nr:PEP-CTERM sorting domain-containing protein [Phycisphaerae bacterium]